MSSPGIRSAPGPAAIRPSSTVPNTTSSRPAAAASTRAQARWKIVAGEVPRSRASWRARAARAGSTGWRAWRAAVPSRRASASPNGAVGSVTSPSSAVK
jgi:hypothetical protein